MSLSSSDSSSPFSMITIRSGTSSHKGTFFVCSAGDTPPDSGSSLFAASVSSSYVSMSWTFLLPIDALSSHLLASSWLPKTVIIPPAVGSFMHRYD